MNQTLRERRTLSQQQEDELERLARKHSKDLFFQRHSPRDQRWLPFADAENPPPVTWPEAAVWAVVAAMLVALMFIVMGLEP